MRRTAACPMTDDDAIRRALEAATYTVQRADQELAACREANARLTAQLVATELRERMLRDLTLAQAARIDDLEGRLNRWMGA